MGSHTQRVDEVIQQTSEASTDQAQGTSAVTKMLSELQDMAVQGNTVRILIASRSMNVRVWCRGKV